MRVPATFHSSEARRELRRIQRRRGRERSILFLAALLVLLLFAAIFLGRAYRYERRVEAFVGNVERCSTAQVKTALDGFAPGLGDSNPLIRRGAMAAFRAGTGWRLGTDAEDWQRHWAVARDNWGVKESVNTNRPPLRLIHD